MAVSQAEGPELSLGLFDSVQRAAVAIDAMIGSGCARAELGCLMTDRAAERAFGHAEVRDGAGVGSTFSADVHALAGTLQPLAPLGTAGAGLVAAGPLAALLVAAFGTGRSVEQALEELGLARDAAEVARRLARGGVLVSAPMASGPQLQQALATDSALFWRVAVTTPLTRSAVVTEPLAPAPDRSARHRPVFESPDDARRSSVGVSKHGT